MTNQMTTDRLEAFSDCVMSIILTIMVLSFKIPHEPTLAALTPLVPVFLTYLLSFIYVGIYWNNHHHMLQATTHVNGAILWANLHFLFWLSLIPFVTGWMGENHFSRTPTALYGCVLFMVAIGFSVLQRAILKEHGKNSVIAQALQHDHKAILSPVLYAAAIGMSFVWEPLAALLYGVVALMWLFPDRRIETKLNKPKTKAKR